MASHGAGGGHDAAAIARIESRILLIRGRRVILDADLAMLYGVPTKRLNEQVKRNSVRFPPDFMFRLTRAEVEDLNRSQIATAWQKHRDPRFPPFAFTEHGAIMAANVLNSPNAVRMSIHVVRAIVRLRQELSMRRELVHRLAELEGRIDTHDAAIRELVAAIRQLAEPPPDPARPRIGFRPEGKQRIDRGSRTP